VAEIAETVVRGVSQDGRIEPHALVPILRSGQSLRSTRAKNENELRLSLPSELRRFDESVRRFRA
jgi:hypothetical protein